MANTNQLAFGASVQDVGTYYPGQQKILSFPQSVWGNGNKVGGVTSVRSDLVEVWDWNSTGATLKIIKGVAGRSTKVSITVDYYDASKNFKRESYVYSITVKTNPIQMTESSITMDVGKTHQLTYKGTVAGMPVPDATWSTSNSSVATVGFTGVVTAKSSGTAKITATSTDGEETYCTITVNKEPEQEPLPTVSASPSSGTYEKGTKIYLTASQSNATIRYTTNGSTPTSSSQKYSSYITLNESFTLKARAYNTSGSAGDVLTCNYTVKEDPNALNYNILSTTEKTVEVIPSSNGRYKGDIVIPSYVKIDGITYTVTSIGNRAFYSCSGLTSVTIPNTVTSIDECAFSFCSGLTAVSIPNSVFSIGNSAFSSCRGLKSIKVDKSNNNFSDVDGVLYNKTITELIQCPGGLTAISIPNSVSSIGEDAFFGCSGLTAITIPNSVTSIGNSAFSLCSSLTAVSIPNSVSSIGEYAFSYCRGLTAVTIPNSVNSIGEYAFKECSGLTAIYYGAKNPIEGSSNIFSDYTMATLYVPRSAVEKYKQIDPWKNFSKIEAYNFSGIDEIAVDLDSELPYEFFNLNGVMLGNSTDNLVPGIYIVRQGLKTKKIIIR